MLCARCKKRQAVVFIQRLEAGKPVQEGVLCFLRTGQSVSIDCRGKK